MPHPIRSLLAAALLASGLANAASPAPAPLRPTLEQMSQLEGVYNLANGKRVHIVQGDDRLYAELNKNERFELFVTGPDTLGSRNGRVTVRLTQADQAAPLFALRQTGTTQVLLSSL